MEDVHCCSIRTLLPDVKVKSIYLHDTRRVLPDKVGVTRYHVACFLSTTTAQRPGILHSDVSPHVQQFCQKAWRWKEDNPYYPRSDASRSRGRGCWRFQRGCLATRQQCGDQGRFRVRGQTCVDSSTPQIQMNSGKYANTAHFSIPHEALGIRQTQQSCHQEVWVHLDFVERRSVQSHHENRTKARVAWNVVLSCSNRASICSLALFEYKHQSVALIQTRLICGSLSVYTHPSTALCFKHV